MREKNKQNQNLKCYTFENSSLSEYNWVKFVLFFKTNYLLNDKKCSKSLVKDLVYEEPFDFRVVHHMLLTFFLRAKYIFFNI